LKMVSERAVLNVGLVLLLNVTIFSVAFYG
jgi:hypothetical protein